MKIDANEILAKMRADADSDWPALLLRDLQHLPVVDEAVLARANEPRNITIGRLTAGESRVLAAYSYGLDQGMIAAVFDISVWTVRDHLKAARVKLGAKTTGHAACVAIRKGLIQ